MSEREDRIRQARAKFHASPEYRRQVEALKRIVKEGIGEAPLPPDPLDPPDDATSGEIVAHFLHVGRTMKPVGQWPGERVYSAIERLITQRREFISPKDRVQERGHNGRGGD